MNLETLLLAFFSGAMGAMIGGTATFVITGFIGLIVLIISHCGGDVTLLNNEVLNLIFMPCVCFNGATAGMAFSANRRNHKLNGADGNRSLYFTGDYRVLLVSGVFGLVGYLVYYLLTCLKLSADIGAFTVLSVNFLIRFLFGTGKIMKKPEVPLLRKATMDFWIFQILFALIIGVVSGYFILKTGLITIGFSMSALSLIFAFSNPEFPVTHHITMVVGYAILMINSLLIAVIFGVISQIIFIVFTNYFNVDLDTHVDGPAASIGLCSLVLISLF